jgi:hypothetical protein
MTSKPTARPARLRIDIKHGPALLRYVADRIEAGATFVEPIDIHVPASPRRSLHPAARRRMKSRLRDAIPQQGNLFS